MEIEIKMKLQWTCADCHKEQATYLSEADWVLDRDRCNDVEGVIIYPTCSYCESRDNYEEIR